MVHRSLSSAMLGISGCLSGLTVAFLATSAPSPAHAQFWLSQPQGSYYRPRASLTRPRLPRRVAARPAKPSAEEVAAAKAVASGPLLAVVSLGAQRLTVYDSTGPILRSPVSSGTAGHRTPTGVFSVIQKNRHHVSNIYSGAPMPYMQRITWSGIAMHAGVLPGYPASHGCIRLPFPVAARLFSMSKMGMRVIVAPHEPTAASFSHAALPEPVMVAAPAGAPNDRQADAGEVRVATTDAAPVATRFLNPVQNAQLERVKAKASVVDAIKANQLLLEESRRASAEAHAAAAELRSAQAAHDGLRSRLGRATADERGPLEALLADSERTLTAARAIDAEKNRAAFAAAVASRDAEEAVPKAEAAAKVAERGTEPIAVLISRKEGKVLVRQGMMPLFEAPVTFKEPTKPLGTHVFQAMSADGATGRIGWTAVTVPESISLGDSLDNRGPVRRGERTAVDRGPPSDARGALDRVEMTPDVRQRIAERLWINGSIVVSDHGLGRETGKGTDFIVETR